MSSMKKDSDWIEIKKNPEHVKRERKKAKALRKSDWWKKKLETGICYYCQKTFSPEKLTMDHILAVIRGGKSTKGNCVPSCKDCNNTKKFLTPAEIIMQQMDND